MRDDRAEIEAIKAAHDIVEAAGRYTTLRRAGRELVGLSPFKAERTPSFYVDPRKQTFYCFCTAQGGDVIRLVAIKDFNGDDGAAIQHLKQSAGIPDDPEIIRQRAEEAAARRHAAEEAERREKARAVENARGIWRETKPGQGSLVETYLRARGIDIDAIHKVCGWYVPPTIRFHPRLPYRVDGEIVHVGPAMVGLLQTVPGEKPGAQMAVHRTWLAVDGSMTADKAGLLPKGHKAKLTLGSVWGCGGWLEWRGGMFIAGEGYETTMSVQGVYAAQGKRVSAVSGASLGNLAGAGIGPGTPHPEREGYRLPSEQPDNDKPGLVVPAFMRRGILLGDNDGKDPLSTRALVTRGLEKFRRAGADMSAAWPPKGKDFNDLVRENGLTAGAQSRAHEGGPAS